jgi:AsmA-like C-terminal region
MTVAIQEPVQAKSTSAGSRPKWLIPLGVVILALLCVGGLILAFHWPFSSQKVIQSVQEDWPGKITVQQFHRTYFPHPGCILENVALTRESGISGPPLVAIQKITIQANYHDLLLRPGYVYRIVLEGLKISIPAENHSVGSPPTSKSSDSSVRLGEVFTKDAILEIATKADGPLKFEIHQLTLKSIASGTPMSYDLAMRNPEPPGEIRSRGKLGPWNSQDLDHIPLQGNYTFDHVDLGVFDGIAGTLAAKGEFHGALGRIETQGTTEIPNFEVTRSQHAVPLKTKFIAAVDGTGGDTVLKSVDATIMHTAVHAEGAVAAKPGQPGKTVSLDMTVRDGHIDDVLWLFVKGHKPPMKGTTNFHAHVVWPSTQAPFIKHVVLQGDFDIENAQWENPDKQASLNTLSKRASGNKKDANTADVSADIKGNVLLSLAIANFKDTSFKVPGAEADVKGTYNLENAKIDFHGDLKTESSLSDETSGVKAALLKPLDPLFKRKRAGAVVPVEMTGTYKDPHFGISLPGK